MSEIECSKTVNDIIKDEELVLLRQIHPNYYKGGRLSKSSFNPTPRDKGNLSVNNKNMIAPDLAYSIWTEVLKMQSDAVYGVSVKDVKDLGLEPYHDEIDCDDSLPEKRLNESHALIFFKGLDKKRDRKELAIKLSQLATREFTP